VSDDTKAPKDAGEEAANGVALLADLITGRKTIKGIINEELEKFFGPEKSDAPAAAPAAETKPTLTAIAGGKG
jgi:hypothetical protein